MDNTRKGSAKKYINFLINTERDADILKWIAMQDNKSEAIREAIRLSIQQSGHVVKQEITLEDIYNELQEIKKRGFVMDKAKSNDYTEPADIAANLDKLGL